MPASQNRRLPRIQAALRCLATKACEKCGLVRGLSAVGRTRGYWLSEERENSSKECGSSQSFFAQLAALARPPACLLLHVACGIAAIAIGPLQFLPALRASRPKVHRAAGYLYLAAVFVGGGASVRLVPDTARFAAEALSDTSYLELVGITPAAAGFPPNATYAPSQFALVVVAFAMLSAAWLITSAVALWRARQRRFDDHRAWMIRSYSLTFAAVTVRLTSLPLLLLTRDPVVAITLSFWSWIVNLMVAEWIVRRAARSKVFAAAAATA